jgi:hypothetical protein
MQGTKMRQVSPDILKIKIFQHRVKKGNIRNEKKLSIVFTILKKKNNERNKPTLKERKEMPFRTHRNQER